MLREVRFTFDDSQAAKEFVDLLSSMGATWEDIGYCGYGDDFTQPGDDYVIVNFNSVKPDLMLAIRALSSPF